jgi:hypothetical protein
MEELYQATNERGVTVAYYNSVSPTAAGADATKDILPQPIPLPPVNGNPDPTRPNW